MTTGILLINLGTPDSFSESDVRDFLSALLSDPYVITLPKLWRDLLVQKIILPKRIKKTAAAYQKIWTSEGSPLLVNSVALAQALQKKLGEEFVVALGMRYKNPSIEHAIKILLEKQCKKLMVLPLFPQYAEATTASALKLFVRFAHTRRLPPAPLKESKLPPAPLWEYFMIEDFYNKDFYIQSYASLIQQYLKPNDFLLLSFHGLPKRANRKQAHPCYRTQCFETARLIAHELNLPAHRYDVAFQSRLGFTRWIQPYTHQLIQSLRKKDIENLSVVCPSFVADCVETLEEIGIRLREQWMQLGGKRFTLIPCLNADETWVDAIARFVQTRTLPSAPMF